MVPHYGLEGIAKFGILNIEQGLEAYLMNKGSYPTSEQGLEVLLNEEKGTRYLRKLSNDPWGRPFHYRYPGAHNPDFYDLWSNGKDAIEGTKDDIANFK